MRDAGDALDAAGDAVVADAQADAPIVLDVPCDVERTYRTRQPLPDAGVFVVSQSAWFAEVPLPAGVTPADVEAIDVLLCDIDAVPMVIPACPADAGVTCSGDYPYRDSLDCTTGGAEFDATTIRVNCGSAQNFACEPVGACPGYPTLDIRARRRTARITVRTR